MNDLPQTNPSQDGNVPLQQPNIQQPISHGAKETEAGFPSLELPLTSTSQEIDLPKEVVAQGVSVQPQPISLPPQIVQAGLKTTHTTSTPVVAKEEKYHLPLSDEQIARGLHESMTSSIRWLAEWCVRKIQMMHAVVTKKH